MKRQIALSATVGLLAISPNTHGQAPIPGGVASAGLTHIVQDTQVWYNKNKLPDHVWQGYVTNGPIYNLNDQIPTTYTGDGGNHGNWEPYISVMGESTFLVGVSIYADDGSWNNSTNHIGVTGNQRYVVALQPAVGGPSRIGEVFYDDFGAPYSYHQMMRQRNPSVRIAGDKRYGTTHYLSGGAAALMYGKFWFGIDYFNSDGRLNTSFPLYGTGFGSMCNQACSGTPPGTSDSQWAFLQSFSLNPTSLAQTPLHNAQEILYYPAWTNSIPTQLANAAAGLPGGNQNVSYFGGEVAALDDGNYVVVADDYTGFFGSTVNSAAAVAKIFRPDGSTVKDSWLVDPHEIWSNLAAYRGGFAVRVQGEFYFYNNAGNLIASNALSSSTGMTFDPGRGDGTRIASDIRSSYVYIAGPVIPPDGGLGVGLGIWDGRTGAFVTNGVVSSDLDAFSMSRDRVNLAVDALDRVTVAYNGKPDTSAGFQDQLIARVMSFDGTNIAYLTPSFFPFLCSDNTNNISTNSLGTPLGFKTTNPSVAMTTKAICFAAKSTLNSTNNPASGPDSGADTDAYVVVSHPAPVAPPQPKLTVTRSGGNAIISWQTDAGLFTVQSRASLTSGSWADETVQNVAPPVSVAMGAGTKYFRAVRQW